MWVTKLSNSSPLESLCVVLQSTIKMISKFSGAFFIFYFKKVALDIEIYNCHMFFLFPNYAK